MNSEINGMQDHLDNITDDTRALIEATANTAETKVAEARNRLTSALESAKEAYAKVQKKAVEGAKATDKVIRNNPYQAIGIAFGVGALVGFLISRRK